MFTSNIFTGNTVVIPFEQDVMTLEEQLVNTAPSKGEISWIFGQILDMSAYSCMFASPAEVVTFMSMPPFLRISGRDYVKKPP